MDQDYSYRNKIISILLVTTGMGGLAVMLVTVMFAVQPLDGGLTKSDLGLSNSCTTRFAVSTPVELTTVTASGGAVFAGTACESDLIWLLEFNPVDRYYYRANESPLPVSSTGTWEFLKAPIGNMGDEPGTDYPIAVFRASPQCSLALHTMSPDSSGTVRFKSLPTSCPSTADGHNAFVVHVEKGGP